MTKLVISHFREIKNVLHVKPKDFTCKRLLGSFI